MRGQWPFVALVVLAAGIALGAAHAGRSGGAADVQCDEETLPAYREAPEVGPLAEGFTKRGYQDHGVLCLPVGGSCGVAGCSYETLVVHRFSTAGANPQTGSILARVSGMAPHGRPRAELVTIVPVRDRAHQPPGSDGGPSE